MSFEYEHILSDRDRGIEQQFLIHFTSPQGEVLTITTEDFLWSALALPPQATPEWVETTCDHEFFIVVDSIDRGRGLVIPALSSYLRAIDEARVTRNPQLIRDLNRFTSWIENQQGLHRSDWSRRISEELLNPESLEVAIQNEIDETLDPVRKAAEILQCTVDEVYERDELFTRFLPDEYTRLRRLGYKPEQIHYDQVRVRRRGNPNK